MQKSNKLNGKDLINVGIYTAMTLVIFFVFGLLTSLPVIYPFLLFIWPFVCGIPMMLYYTKNPKIWDADNYRCHLRSVFLSYRLYMDWAGGVDTGRNSC